MNDAYAEITFQFRFQTVVRNPDSFLYNTGPITSLNSPYWNRFQLYTVTMLQNGSATFDGTVTGEIGTPRFDGRLVGRSFAIEGHLVDSLEADVTASPDVAQLRNATATRKAVRTRLNAIVALKDWKYNDDSLIYGDARTENAPMSCMRARTGFVRGPSMLNTVRPFKSSRASCACFTAGCSSGA